MKYTVNSKAVYSISKIVYTNLKEDLSINYPHIYREPPLAIEPMDPTNVKN